MPAASPYCSLFFPLLFSFDYQVVPSPRGNEFFGWLSKLSSRQWFLGCGPRTNSISIIWERVAAADSPVPPPGPPASEAPGVICMHTRAWKPGPRASLFRVCLWPGRHMTPVRNAGPDPAPGPLGRSRNLAKMSRRAVCTQGLGALGGPVCPARPGSAGLLPVSVKRHMGVAGTGRLTLNATQLSLRSLRGLPDNRQALLPPAPQSSF